MAHACGVSVEGEIGCLGSLETGMAGEEDGVGAEGVLDHSQLLNYLLKKHVASLQILM